MLLGPERVESRAYSGPSFSIGDPALAEFFGMGGQTLAGVPVNESSSLGLTSVFRAVSIIAGTIGGLPLRSYRTDSDGQRQRVPTFLDNPSGPGGPYTQFEWLELVMVCLLLHGNAFLQHIYNGGGAIVGLLPLPPSAVTVRPIQTGEELANYGGPDGTYRKWFEIQLADGSRRELTCAELTHIPALGTDGVRGLSPIEVHRQALGTALAGDRAAARLFGSGLLLGGLVTGDDSLSREDAEEAVAQLRAKMAGSDHAGDILFLNAQLKFQPWTIPPADAQFLESRVHSVTEVCRIYGVPKVLLAEDGASTWGSGIAELNRWFARTALFSWTTRLEQRLSLLLTRPTACEFDYKGLLQPAPEVEIPLLISQLKAGILTTDEIRRMFNLPSLPAGAAPSDTSPNGPGTGSPAGAEVPA
jgi:HK97 family phage portal protein